jgi:hypothetical protein
LAFYLFFPSQLEFQEFFTLYEMKKKKKKSRRCPNGSKGKIEIHLRRAWEAITPTYYKCDQYRAPPPSIMRR